VPGELDDAGLARCAFTGDGETRALERRYVARGETEGAAVFLGDRFGAVVRCCARSGSEKNGRALARKRAGQLLDNEFSSMWLVLGVRGLLKTENVPGKLQDDVLEAAARAKQGLCSLSLAYRMARRVPSMLRYGLPGATRKPAKDSSDILGRA